MAPSAVEQRRAARRDLVRRRARRSSRTTRGALHIAVPRRVTCRAPRSARSSRRCRHAVPHRPRAGRARAARARAGAARARGATRASPTVEGAGEPGARARAPDRPHDPADLRRRRARRRSPRTAGSATSTRTRRRPRSGTQYPELDHNEICAWGQHGDVTRQLITLVELRHGFEHDAAAAALRRRRARSSTSACTRCSSVEAEGEGRLAQLLDLMYVGDWVSCYLALQNDVDPGPIDAIFELKDRLGS